VKWLLQKNSAIRSRQIIFRKKRTKIVESLISLL
jgi:hypothetical protein